MKSLRSSTAIRKPARTLPRVGAMKATRTSLVIAAAAAGLVAAAGPAQAGPLPPEPTRSPSRCPVLTLLATTASARFPVTVQIFSGQKVTQTTLPNGATEHRFTGHAEAIVTNDDDASKSITYNISGPGTRDGLTPDGSFTIDAAGPNLLWTTVENSAPAGVPQLAYTTGRVRLAVNNTGHTDQLPAERPLHGRLRQVGGLTSDGTAAQAQAGQIAQRVGAKVGQPDTGWELINHQWLSRARDHRLAAVDQIAQPRDPVDCRANVVCLKCPVIKH